MNDDTTVRAWKDPVFRQSLENAQGIEHPAGTVELTGDQLDGVSGGTTIPCATATIAGSILISVNFCSPDGTFCGTCEYGTNGCC